MASTWKSLVEKSLTNGELINIVNAKEYFRGADARVGFVMNYSLKNKSCEGDACTMLDEYLHVLLSLSPPLHLTCYINS